MKTIRNKLEEIWDDDNQSDFSNPLCSFLYTLSLIYSGIIRSRNYFYDTEIFETKRLPCPVISVGNLTTGGTGKTPMVILLASLCRDRGKRPAVLSRGYGGKGSGGINIISDGERILQGPEEAGDEPLLIAGSVRQVPVITGADRYLTGRHAIDHLGVDVLVLDDAFQHRRLFRDINILLLDAERPFGNGFTLPRGSLREPGSALKRADMIVLTRADENRETASLEREREMELTGIPIFRSVHRPTEIIRMEKSDLSFPYRRESIKARTGIPDQIRNDSPLLKGGDVLPPDFIRGKRVCAFAGIARPESFRKTIEALGGDIADFRTFPDHHRYTKAELEAVLRTWTESRAEIILTTEKDGIKLPGLGFSLPDIYVLRVELDIFPERERFENMILARLTA